MEFGVSFFWLSMETKGFLMIWGLGWYLGVLPPTSTYSCLLEVEIGESPDDRYIHDTTVTACVFPRRARTMPLSEQQ